MKHRSYNSHLETGRRLRITVSLPKAEYEAVMRLARARDISASLLVSDLVSPNVDAFNRLSGMLEKVQAMQERLPQEARAPFLKALDEFDALSTSATGLIDRMGKQIDAFDDDKSKT